MANSLKTRHMSEYEHSLTFRVRCCCRSNELTRAPIANPPNSAQLVAPLQFPQVTSGSVK